MNLSSIGTLFHTFITHAKALEEKIVAGLDSARVAIDKWAPIVGDVVGGMYPQAKTAEQVFVAVFDAFDNAVDAADKAGHTGDVNGVPAEIVAQYKVAKASVQSHYGVTPIAAVPAPAK